MALFNMQTFIPILIVIFIISLILLAIAAVFALIEWITQNKKSRLDFTNPVENLRDSLLTNCPDNIRNYNLKLSGDPNHSGIKIGRIVGYTRVIDHKAKNEDQKIVNVLAYIKTWKILDFFFLKMMKRVNIFAFYEYQLGSKLIGDVELIGVATRKISGFEWIIDKDFSSTAAVRIIQDIAITDYSADITKQTAQLVGTALAANPHIRALKELDQQNIGTIPDNTPRGSR